MAARANTGTVSHPSPRRHLVPAPRLFFGLIGGPAAWFLQLVLNYALASYTCFPHALPVRTQAPIWPGTWTTLLIVNIAGMTIALAAAFVSWRAWRTTHGEQPGPTSHLMEVGEGRTRFIASVGMIAALGFTGAILFDTVAILVVPPCLG